MVGEPHPKTSKNGGARPAGFIPAWKFDVANLPSRQRADAWREVCSGFYDPTLGASDDVGPTGFSWHRLDDLMFSSGVSHPHVAKRTAAHVKRQRNYVRLLFTGQGTSRIAIGERFATLSGGAIHLIDYARPFVHIRNESINLNGVYVPHDTIGYDPSRDPAHLCIGLDTPVGQILAGTFTSLLGQLEQIKVTDAPAIAEGFAALLRALLLQDRRCERGLAVLRSARRDAMRRYIERNLRDPALDSDCLRRNFGASRATVYRDFAADGGVAHYIMDRRLERALSDLVQQTPMRGLVTAVAQDWHFDSVSHFSQRFRQKFGVSPSDMVALAAPTAEAESGTPRAGAGAPEPQRAGNLSTWFRIGCA